MGGRMVQSHAFRGLRVAMVSLLLLSGCASPPPPVAELRGTARPVILLTDAGCEVDDQWALAYLLLKAEEGAVDLRAVITTHAPGLKEGAESSAEKAREVVKVLAPLEPPVVIAGSSAPLEPAGGPRRGLGPQFIVEMAKGFGPQRRLAVLAIGAATDLASAILIDPRTAERIEVVAMGFEGWPRGGDPWNVKNDPQAYRVILASGAPLVVASAEVCSRHLTIDEGEGKALTGGGGEAGRYLEAQLEDWLSREAELCRKTTGRRAWPIWDLATAAHLLGMTRDEPRARPRLKEDLSFDLEGAAGSIRWITGIDQRRLWADFKASLERWAKEKSIAKVEKH
jgi:purine nucleosidase